MRGIRDVRSDTSHQQIGQVDRTGVEQNVDRQIGRCNLGIVKERGQFVVFEKRSRTDRAGHQPDAIVRALGCAGAAVRDGASGGGIAREGGRRCVDPKTRSVPVERSGVPRQRIGRSYRFACRGKTENREPYIVRHRDGSYCKRGRARRNVRPSASLGWAVRQAGITAPAQAAHIGTTSRGQAHNQNVNLHSASRQV